MIFLSEMCFRNIITNPNRNSIIERNMRKAITPGEVVFFELYRKDGLHLTSQSMEYNSQQIDLYFYQYGEKRNYNPYLSYARSIVNDDFFSNVPLILDVFLETTIFVPNISWEQFIKEQEHYMMKKSSDYLMWSKDGVVFSYSDSGDFSIEYDYSKINPCFWECE